MNTETTARRQIEAASIDRVGICARRSPAGAGLGDVGGSGGRSIRSVSAQRAMDRLAGYSRRRCRFQATSYSSLASRTR
jgi:hypothetical protein